VSGIFGVVSRDDCSSLLMYGTDYHSHMGTEYGGVAILGEEFYRQIHNISHSQFKSKFFEDTRRMKGNKGIGVISDSNEQPMYVNSRFGPFCIVTSGLIDNAGQLSRELMASGVSFSEMCGDSVNVTELVAKMICTGKDLVDGINQVFSRIEGSCSMLVLNAEGIYAARDRSGYTSLVVGKKDGAWAVTSETSAFPNNGLEIVKYLGPSEIVLITDKGMELRQEAGKEEQICSFLWVYTGFPASSYDGINTEIVRERCGKALAAKDGDIEIDLVSGIPDSGIGHALGYAMESGKPLRRPLVKYTPGYGRSYTPPSQATRDLVATMKLIPIKEVVEGNRIVVCEDSIVRGTQLKNFTVKKLWDAGAREIHVRVACPPLMFPCKFCLSTRSVSELAARKAIESIESEGVGDVSEYTDETSLKYRDMVEWIRKDIGATTLRYQTLEDMVEAIGLPREKLCTYCWTGKSVCGGCK
jgi:amidophosphoribosyltransferase